MPRSAGIYTPPGTSFPAVPSTLIESAKYNAVINDIATALTQSIATNGTSTVSANISMGNNKVTNLAIGTTSGDAIRNSQIARGTDINITASGLQSVPSDGGNFAMTAAASFNITGFSSTTFTGRMFSIKFPTNFTQNLVNSATFKLRDGVSRTTVKGETAFFILQSVGPPVFEEIANQSVLDLTGYTGADLSLGVNQSAIYTVTAAATLLLRIATATNQRYEIVIMPDNVATTNQTASTLQPNNANTGAGAVNLEALSGVQATPTASVSAINTFLIDQGGTPYGVIANVHTRTTGKVVFAMSLAASTLAGSQVGLLGGRWSDTTTVWSSLGTLNWVNAWTGLVQVTRKL